MPPNVFVLYAEVMPYTVVTFRAFLERYPDGKLTVVHYGADKKLSGYQVPEHDRITYYTESELSKVNLLQLFADLDPNLVLCSGRMEEKYLAVLLKAKQDGVVRVGNSDNHYHATLRQRVAILFSYFFYRRYFDFMLVPGKPQLEYCLKLGFKQQQVLFPQYCADVRLFEKAYEIRHNRTAGFSGMLFIGRLEKIKGIDGLIENYISLYDAGQITEKLHVVGNGSLRDTLNLDHSSIEYIPFLPQEALIEIMATVRGFILPSHREAWGVVIHEAAAAGLPILTTTTCGAASQFLENGKNGFVFEPSDNQLQKKLLVQMEKCSQQELRNMGERSHQLSLSIKPEMWAESLVSCIE